MKIEDNSHQTFLYMVRRSTHDYETYREDNFFTVKIKNRTDGRIKERSFPNKEEAQEYISKMIERRTNKKLKREEELYIVLEHGPEENTSAIHRMVNTKHQVHQFKTLLEARRHLKSRIAYFQKNRYTLHQSDGRQHVSYGTVKIYLSILKVNSKVLY